jgi:MerR family transcriptional regulator, heat shock protein HspR
MTLTNDRPDAGGQPADSHGVYGISVAAELSGIPVQSLRLYESHGLLTPIRSDGGTRRYSADDLARLRRISRLVDAGVNLAGIGRILELEDDNAALLAENRADSDKATRKPEPS